LFVCFSKQTQSSKESGVSCSSFSSTSKYFGIGTENGKLRLFSCDHSNTIFPDQQQQQQLSPQSNSELPKLRLEFEQQVKTKNHNQKKHKQKKKTNINGFLIFKI